VLRTAIEYGAGQAPAPMLPHLRYFGDYELLEEIARGGMGVVYRARQVSLDRQVAVKMMRPGLLASEAEIQRFRAEARTAASLQHPSIVAIHEVGEFEGLHYFSMDLVEGPSLAALVREKPLGPAEAARHVRTLAEAVEYAHSRGVLHRDLKPSNVLLDGAGRPRITDFGLARPIDGGADSGAKIAGTPAYMPPEQAAGEELGPASGVYSLGAILYELLTGLPPFRGGRDEVLRQVKEEKAARPRTLNPAVGRELDAICMRCLEKDPAQRYPTATELAAGLARVERTRARSRVRWLLPAAAVALGVLVFLIARTERAPRVDYGAIPALPAGSAPPPGTKMERRVAAPHTRRGRLPAGAATASVVTVKPMVPPPGVLTATPAAVSVSPQNGAGRYQVFRFLYTEDIGAAEIRIHDDTRACAVFAEVNGRVSLEARPEGSPGLRVSGDAGSLSTLENGVCRIDLSGAGFHKEGGGLELMLPVTFKPSFAGRKEVISLAWDKDEKQRGKTATAGNWTVER
jgi:tRNA A-37 threonylcarbamoyl transferase component Bud32